MKLVSASGLVFYVKDMAKTTEFYKTLGFRIDKQESDHLSVGLNCFGWIFIRRTKKISRSFSGKQ